MKLDRSLEGKKARIIDTDGDVFEGKIMDYIFPEDNEPEGEAAIDFYTTSGEWVGFNETDIESIEIIG